MKKDYYKILNLPKDSEISDQLVEKNYTIIQRQIDKMKQKTPTDKTLLECERRVERAYSALKTLEGRREYDKILELQKREEIERERKNNTIIQEQQIEERSIEIQNQQDIHEIKYEKIEKEEKQNSTLIQEQQKEEKPIKIENQQDIHEIKYEEIEKEEQKKNFREEIRIPQQKRSLEAFIMYRGKLGKTAPKRKNIDNER